MIVTGQQGRGDKPAMPHTVCIMQPYFIPYAGYFRLFAVSDLFVIYDCVQFPRRGWVHRNELIDASGQKRWITLPINKAPQSVLIKDLEFSAEASEQINARLQPFPDVRSPPAAAESIVQALLQANGTPLAYIELLLKRITEYLELPWNVVRSSSLEIPAEFHGQDRILEILRRVGARRYVNSPGGRELYSKRAFDEAGVELNFLPDYDGPTFSILARILVENRDRLAAEMIESIVRV